MTIFQVKMLRRKHSVFVEIGRARCAELQRKVAPARTFRAARLPFHMVHERIERYRVCQSDDVAPCLYVDCAKCYDTNSRCSRTSRIVCVHSPSFGKLPAHGAIAISSRRCRLRRSLQLPRGRDEQDGCEAIEPQHRVTVCSENARMETHATGARTRGVQSSRLAVRARRTMAFGPSRKCAVIAAR